MKNKTLFQIDIQGAAVVNTASIFLKEKGIVCIDIDMKSKYCITGGYCITNNKGTEIPGIFIEANKDSLYVLNNPEDTLLMFPMFEGYTVYATNSGRYTISVVLVKKETK